MESSLAQNSVSQRQDSKFSTGLPETSIKKKQVGSDDRSTPDLGAQKRKQPHNKHSSEHYNSTDDHLPMQAK